MNGRDKSDVVSNGEGRATRGVPTLKRSARMLAAALAAGLLGAFAPRAEAVLATGGTVTNYANFTAHSFTNPGTTNINFSFGGVVDVLVVGGGGGGGGGIGGGGGAGGVVYVTNLTVTAGNYTLVVGGGGTGGVSQSRGGYGTNSTAFGIIAAGGGGGGNFPDVGGLAGGSGGGAGAANTGGPATGGLTNGSSLGGNMGTIYGNRGGNQTANRATGDTPTSARAGGGAGAPGADENCNTTPGGDGGVGVANAILGVTYHWGGGGAGAAYKSYRGGNGGLGGGGGGASRDTSGGGFGGTSALNAGGNAGNGLAANGASGGANTGGGGGGGTWQHSTGGRGGSGIVIVRYVKEPTVTLTAPMHNQSFFSGSTITATAVVYNASGTSTVRFYTNTASGISYGLAGTVESSPYELNLGSSLAVTNYLIYATASNATDDVFTSDTNAFSVLAPGPVVTNVTSTTADGAYKAGVSIDVQVMFDTAVTVAGGTPRVKLETGGTDRYANFTGGSDTDTLTFQYEVLAGDTSADLDYWSTSALELNGATIKDTVSSADAYRDLATPGAAKSLGFNKDLVIDTTAESVINVTSAKVNGTYKAPEVIDITVEFNGTMQVTGTPQLELETGGTDRKADYLSGSPGTTLTFRYTVQAGDASSDLDYTGVGALTLNGGTIADAAGNDATLTLVAPGAAGSLGANKALVIDAVAETLDSIDNNDPDNAVNTYDIVTYTLTFSDDILHTTVDATDFDNAAASPSLFTVLTITETTPGVFSVQVRPTTAGNLKLRVKSDAVITDPVGNQVSGLPVSDGETIVVRLTPWARGGVGGTVTEYTDLAGKKWTAHIFTTVGSSNITFASPGLVEYLVVGGGGGGGGGYQGGGGGAGGMLTGTVYVAASSHAITVSDGGNGKRTATPAVNGNSSSFNPGSIITALGGGRGASEAPDAAAGGGIGVRGSGGGGCNGDGGGSTGGLGTPGQGNNGGNGIGSGGFPSGGGGGAGGAGYAGNAAAPNAMKGGPGLASAFAGTSVTYATGGNGRTRTLGVGADGTPANSGNGGNAGGGAVRDPSSDGGKGASGIVVIRYALVPPSGTILLLR